eukprot:scaffold136067_cov34-Prasinocladus_malaysianus.AAC.2
MIGQMCVVSLSKHLVPLCGQPWRRRMESRGAQIKGGWRVQKVLLDERQQGRDRQSMTRARGVKAQRATGEVREFLADVTVLAVGVKVGQPDSLLLLIALWPMLTYYV